MQILEILARLNIVLTNRASVSISVLNLAEISLVLFDDCGNQEGYQPRLIYFRDFSQADI